MQDREDGQVREVRRHAEGGTANMYLLWHDARRPPVVLVGMEEVKVYIQLMRTLCKTTPHWCKIDEDYYKGQNI